MTVSQLFEAPIGRKTVWTKTGDKISKREVMTLYTVQPRSQIEVKKS